MRPDQAQVTSENNWFAGLAWFLGVALAGLLAFLFYQQYVINSREKSVYRFLNFVSAGQNAMYSVSNEIIEIRDRLASVPKDDADLANKVSNIQRKYGITAKSVSAPTTEVRGNMVSYKVTYTYESVPRKKLLESLVEIESELTGLKVLDMNVTFDTSSDRCSIANVSFQWNNTKKK